LEVPTGKGAVGEDTAALVGATLLNLVGLAVGAQAALPPGERRAAALIVDEFHAMPGADYEAILAELAKYGASLVLATQSLARLDALDREHQRALRATVFANLDGLFAFHCSAEDARYLVRELGGAVDEEDLVSLGEHRCYARVSERGGRLPVVSLRLDPPPAPEPGLAAALAARSAARHARPVGAVDQEMAARLDAIATARLSALKPAADRTDGRTGADAGTDAGVAADAGGTGGGRRGRGGKGARGDNRLPSRKKLEQLAAQIAMYLGEASPRETAPAPPGAGDGGGPTAGEAAR
jgi:hypothetical protein